MHIGRVTLITEGRQTAYSLLSSLPCSCYQRCNEYPIALTWQLQIPCESELWAFCTQAKGNALTEKVAFSRMMNPRSTSYPSVSGYQNQIDWLNENGSFAVLPVPKGIRP